MSDAYYKANKNAKPSPLLQEAVSLWSEHPSSLEPAALDVGAGQLIDTRFLLTSGFEVTAIDKNPIIISEEKIINSTKLTIIHNEFDKVTFPKDRFDIISAQWALSFNSPSSFEQMFSGLLSSLKVGGVFCGQFYGVQDDWQKTRKEMSFFTREGVIFLLKDMNIIKMEEEHSDIKNIDKEMKHWHVFHVIAKKTTNIH